MNQQVYVSGVGMIPFVKPGTGEHYERMGARAVRMALHDAGLTYDDVHQAYVGYVYGVQPAVKKRCIR